MLFLYLNLIILAANLISANENPIVSIKSGFIRGKSHGHYYSFEGIPYAEPPVGENRFEPPIPYLKSWSNIADATKLHESCIRLDPMENLNKNSTATVIGSEDCLYINIYTPDIENYRLYPVLFYIHGGAFMYGSGDDLRENLIMKHQNMILVTFNYRLGPLGFLSTGDEEIPGNMGLKDQRLALKWIKQNIRAFNGNPEEILISGFSAGAASVQLHLLQPGIENYANAAISFSGSTLCPWVLVQNPLNDAIKMAHHFNCHSNEEEIISTQHLKDCLKKIPASEIINSIRKFHTFSYNPMRIFGPVIESKTVKNAFLQEHPTTLIKNGILSSVPWIAGVNAQDGGLLIADLMKPTEYGKKIREEFNKNPKETLSIMYFINENVNKTYIKEFMELLWKKYDLPEKFNENDYEKFIKPGTDILLKEKVYESLILHGQYSKGKTYGYVYDNPAAYGWANYFSQNSNINFGTHHGDDVFLILDYPPRDLQKFPFRDDEIKNSNKFLNMIEEYARTRIPKFGDFYLKSIDSNEVKITKITGQSVDSIDFIL